MAQVKEKKKESFWDTIKVLIEALLIALVFRTLLFQPFIIPSGSMRPTLLVGDYLFASKYAYGYSRFSIPFSPNLFSGRIWGGTPERGEVVIFRKPSADPAHSDDYIKRVIGLPGDRIQVSDGVLIINGEAVQRENLGQINYHDYNQYGQPNGAVARATVIRETLPNGVTYNTFDLMDVRSSIEGVVADHTEVYHVPPGHYFMMGDNRDASLDSRFPSVGFVPEQNLIGRANLIFFSIGNGASAWQLWRWPTDVRWGRVFSQVTTVPDQPSGS